MENAHNTAHQGGEQSFDTKAIWRTFWILLVITCIELVIGMFIAPHYPSLKIMFNILYMIFTLAKAFYIVAEFMHLGHEIKNLIMTIVVPLLLFIWFVIAFLWDGHSYKTLRNNYDQHHVEKSKQKVGPSSHDAPAKEAGGKE
jgi:cytochrome c oxidase subunit IV